MIDFLIFSLISVSTFEVARTAAAGGQQSILEHPLHGNVSCASVCPPQKPGYNDCVFCRDNCPGYWNWMISVIFDDSSGLVNQTNECTKHNFTHVPSNSVILCSSFRNFTNATEKARKFWNTNCISYFVCVIRKSITVLSRSNISSTTLPSADPTTVISSSEQPKQTSLLPLFIVPIILGVLCIVLCGCLTVLMIRLKRWNLLKHLQRNEHRVEVDLPLNDLPAPGNPIDNADSDEESHLPIEEVGNDSLPTEEASTTPKEVYPSQGQDISLRSVRVEGTQQNQLDGLSSCGPRAVTPDLSLAEGNNSLHPSCNRTKIDSYQQ